MTLGQRLRDLRAEKKITQQELSDTVKIPRSTIGMYEADHRKPRFDELDTLADYFDTSLDYILGRSDVNHGYPRHVIIETKQDLIGSAEKRMQAYFKGMTEQEARRAEKVELMHQQILRAYDAADPGIQMAVRRLLGVNDGDR
jgi:transcriptional regulator with XRE-family HTH domain